MAAEAVSTFNSGMQTREGWGDGSFMTGADKPELCDTTQIEYLAKTVLSAEGGSNQKFYKVRGRVRGRNVATSK